MESPMTVGDTEIRDYEVKRSDALNIGLDLIVEKEGFNLRDYDDPDVEAHIESLSKQFEEGVLLPELIVRRGQKFKNPHGGEDLQEFILVDGHCRYRAARRARERGADIRTLRCRVVNMNELDQVVTMLGSSEGSLKLKMTEVADGYKRLQWQGLSASDIAKRVKKSAEWISKMLSLSEASMEVREMVNSGAVSTEAAVKAIRDHRDGATDFLKKQLKKVQNAGKRKVTLTTMNPMVVPPRIAASVVDSIEAVYAELDEGLLDEISELESLPEEQRTDRRVEVNACILLKLAKMHDQIRAARELKAARLAKRAQKAQGGSEDQEGPQRSSGSTKIYRAKTRRASRDDEHQTRHFDTPEADRRSVAELFDLPAFHETEAERMLESCASH